MSYVDGFVVPVPKQKIEEYREFSRKSGELWKRHGAVEYIECVGDDVPPGKVTSFPPSWHGIRISPTSAPSRRRSTCETWPSRSRARSSRRSAGTSPRASARDVRTSR